MFNSTLRRQTISGAALTAVLALTAASHTLRAQALVREAAPVRHARADGRRPAMDRRAPIRHATSPTSSRQPIVQPAPDREPDASRRQATVHVEFVQPALEEIPLANPANIREAKPGLEEEFKPISAVGTSIRPTAGELPINYAGAQFAKHGRRHQPAGYSRPWEMYRLWWEAPAVCHRPLYFEEINLERHGYSFGPAQPFVSAAHFFARIPALPYLKALDHPEKCVYSLGHYRPGSYAPYHWYCPGSSETATWVEAAAVAGAIVLIP